ncbi:MAG: glycosyltransferase [Candidatus Aminicenantes bacterium]|nr:MAG: glycosyltransferase [Candidatus Aminicenantes bacterium]
MKKSAFVALAVFALCAFAIPGNAQMMQKKSGAMMGPMMTKPAMELGMAMRKLWEDHITYTRNFIISSLANLEDAGKIAERLLKNQDDIGDAIKPVYGAEAGAKLSALLRDHILIAADVVKAAMAGNAAGLDAANKKWYANADDIAAFLSGANPNWTRASLKDMLDKHLEYTTQEVVSRLKKDWAADIEAYDKGHVHMLMFADMLTHGIVKQFPDKFKN